MTSKKETSIREYRDYFVVKSNELIQKGRYNLTTQQQKIVLYAISKIKKEDDPAQWYELSIEELCSICGYALNGGYYYEKVKSDIKRLVSPIWIQYPDKSEWTVSWFGKAQIIPKSGTVRVRFDEMIWDYLFDLKGRYTQYHLHEVLVFKSKYAIRLFEILRSHFTQDELDKGKEKDMTISLDHLREQLCVTAYPEWKEFDRNVIRKAIDEINEYTEQMKVEYRTVKQGRKVTDVIFTVYSPDTWERFERFRNSKDKLSGKKRKQNSGKKVDRKSGLNRTETKEVQK